MRTSVLCCLAPLLLAALTTSRQIPSSPTQPENRRQSFSGPWRFVGSPKWPQRRGQRNTQAPGLSQNSSPIFYQTPTYDPGGSFANSVAMGDFNGDGKLDLALTPCSDKERGCPASGTVGVLLGNGDGTYQLAVISSLGFQPAYLVAADFNGDGKLDLAVGNPHGVVDVLLGKGDGTFAHNRP